MKIKITRFEYGTHYTIGHLYIDDVVQCFTLEDKVRELPNAPVAAWKIPGVTAIPTGEYKCLITPSTRFKRDMPLLCDVPGFAGIRMHTGNTPEDTEGCILLGTYWVGNDKITNSKVAFDKVFPKLQAALAKGDTITVEVS
ncbi:hypothetical protein UFOVP67_13 [uncultured Caudovirales phage]|uniref:DUF5675 domain-containing protein n=1 Tax=uncultured Caudovirales phage TaxID=2100421 RepID=A0A6J5T8K7_9CAUD|nr:hypothetical protein UFOVP67_13 [uncultured Caudovirales phage]